MGSKSRHRVRVEVELRDGTRMERTVAAGRGNENAFASEAEVVAKFKKLALHAVTESQADALVRWFLALDRMDDESALPALLATRT